MAVGQPPAVNPGVQRRFGRRSAVEAARSRGGTPLLVCGLACVVVAAVSAALLATVPSYDPWSWIVWGREVTDPHLSFAVGGGPSWKPLPFLFTTVFGLFGGAAPTLWVITARAGGLLGVVAAYRLGSLLAARARRGPGWLPMAAGAVAALGLVLTQEWSYYMFRGTSEPMLLGACLWAVDRHLAGRHREAFLLGVAASLIRPEAWPFILVYGVWLWRREPGSPMRVAIGTGLLSIPFLWFVPPWIGSGQPFLAASHAKAYNGHLGSHPLLEVLRRGADLQLAPLLVLGVVVVAVAWWRERDRLIAGLALAALGWWVLVVAMTLDGYPGLERFFLPAAGVICVLAGVGVARIAGVVSELAVPGARQGAGSPEGAQGARSSGDAQGAGSLGTREHRRIGRGSSAIAAAVTVVLVAISLALSSGRLDEARAQPAQARAAVTRLDQLSEAARAAGGHHGVFPCRSSYAAVNHGVQTALAWKLHVTLGRVGTSMRHQGVLFIGPHDAIDGASPTVSAQLNRRQLLARAGVWRVYRVWREGHLSSCVGR